MFSQLYKLFRSLAFQLVWAAVEPVLRLVSSLLFRPKQSCQPWGGVPAASDRGGYYNRQSGSMQVNHIPLQHGAASFDQHLPVLSRYPWVCHWLKRLSEWKGGFTCNLAVLIYGNGKVIDGNLMRAVGLSLTQSNVPTNGKRIHKFCSLRQCHANLYRQWLLNDSYYPLQKSYGVLLQLELII